jgi:hypothetical protein
VCWRVERGLGWDRLGWPGDDLLSQALRHSTIGAEVFDGRVRDGIGSGHLAKVTRPAKPIVAQRCEASCGGGRAMWPFRPVVVGVIDISSHLRW